jgi:hypothetical protein
MRIWTDLPAYLRNAILSAIRAAEANGIGKYHVLSDYYVLCVSYNRSTFYYILKGYRRLQFVNLTSDTDLVDVGEQTHRFLFTIRHYIRKRNHQLNRNDPEVERFWECSDIHKDEESRRRFLGSRMKQLCGLAWFVVSLNKEIKEIEIN